MTPGKHNLPLTCCEYQLISVLVVNHGNHENMYMLKIEGCFCEKCARLAPKRHKIVMIAALICSNGQMAAL